MKKFSLIFLHIFIAVLISSCGSSIDSTNDRYKHHAEEKLPTIEKSVSTVAEDFDFTPYFLKIDEAKPTTISTSSNNNELWWNYPKLDLSQRVTTKQPGYRVQIMATDDLGEAQQMRSDVYFKTNKNEIYITYEPPLYKVKVGDYETPSGANNLAFKLNQLGFSPTQVVADTVNIQK